MQCLTELTVAILGAIMFGALGWGVSVSNAEGVNVAEAGTYGVGVSEVGIITACSATGTLRQTANTLTLSGIIFV